MIRVFTIPNGEKLYTFTRGIKNTTQHCLNFSRNSAYLLSSSDTGTIHVFQLEDPLKGDTSRGGNNSIVDENRLATIKANKAAKSNGAGAKWFSFLVPKTCDDFMAASKSTMFINHP